MATLCGPTLPSGAPFADEPLSTLVQPLKRTDQQTINLFNDVNEIIGHLAARSSLVRFIPLCGRFEERLLREFLDGPALVVGYAVVDSSGLAFELHPNESEMPLISTGRGAPLFRAFSELANFLYPRHPTAEVIRQLRVNVDAQFGDKFAKSFPSIVDQLRSLNSEGYGVASLNESSAAAALLLMEYFPFLLRTDEEVTTIYCHGEDFVSPEAQTLFVKALEGLLPQSIVPPVNESRYRDCIKRLVGGSRDPWEDGVDGCEEEIDDTALLRGELPKIERAAVGQLTVSPQVDVQYSFRRGKIPDMNHPDLLPPSGSANARVR